MEQHNNSTDEFFKRTLPGTVKVLHAFCKDVIRYDVTKTIRSADDEGTSLISFLDKAFCQRNSQREESKPPNCAEMSNRDMTSAETDNIYDGRSKESIRHELLENILESAVMCSICRDVFIEPQVLNCHHTFCQYCLALWRDANYTCPICRQPIESVAKCMVLEEISNKMMELLADDYKQKREESVNERKALQDERNISHPRPHPSIIIWLHNNNDERNHVTIAREEVILQQNSTNSDDESLQTTSSFSNDSFELEDYMYLLNTDAQQNQQSVLESGSSQHGHVTEEIGQEATGNSDTGGIMVVDVNTLLRNIVQANNHIPAIGANSVNLGESSALTSGVVSNQSQSPTYQLIDNQTPDVHESRASVQSHSSTYQLFNNQTPDVRSSETIIQSQSFTYQLLNNHTSHGTLGNIPQQSESSIHQLLNDQDVEIQEETENYSSITNETRNHIDLPHMQCNNIYSSELMQNTLPELSESLHIDFSTEPCENIETYYPDITLHDQQEDISLLNYLNQLDPTKINTYEHSTASIDNRDTDAQENNNQNGVDMKESLLTTILDSPNLQASKLQFYLDLGLDRFYQTQDLQEPKTEANCSDLSPVHITSGFPKAQHRPVAVVRPYSPEDDVTSPISSDSLTIKSRNYELSRWLNEASMSFGLTNESTTTRITAFIQETAENNNAETSKELQNEEMLTQDNSNPTFRTINGIPTNAEQLDYSSNESKDLVEIGSMRNSLNEISPEHCAAQDNYLMVLTGENKEETSILECSTSGFSTLSPLLVSSENEESSELKDYPNPALFRDYQQRVGEDIETAYLNTSVPCSNMLDAHKEPDAAHTVSLCFSEDLPNDENSNTEEETQQRGILINYHQEEYSSLVYSDGSVINIDMESTSHSEPMTMVQSTSEINNLTNQETAELTTCPLNQAPIHPANSELKLTLTDKIHQEPHVESKSETYSLDRNRREQMDTRIVLEESPIVAMPRGPSWYESRAGPSLPRLNANRHPSTITASTSTSQRLPEGNKFGTSNSSVSGRASVNLSSKPSSLSYSKLTSSSPSCNGMSDVRNKSNDYFTGHWKKQEHVRSTPCKKGLNNPLPRFNERRTLARPSQYQSTWSRSKDIRKGDKKQCRKCIMQQTCRNDKGWKYRSQRRETARKKSSLYSLSATQTEDSDSNTSLSSLRLERSCDSKAKENNWKKAQSTKKLVNGDITVTCATKRKTISQTSKESTLYMKKIKSGRSRSPICRNISSAKAQTSSSRTYLYSIRRKPRRMRSKTPDEQDRRHQRRCRHENLIRATAYRLRCKERHRCSSYNLRSCRTHAIHYRSSSRHRSLRAQNSMSQATSRRQKAHNGYKSAKRSRSPFVKYLDNDKKKQRRQAFRCNKYYFRCKEKHQCSSYNLRSCRCHGVHPPYADL